MLRNLRWVLVAGIAATTSACGGCGACNADTVDVEPPPTEGSAAAADSEGSADEVPMGGAPPAMYEVSHIERLNTFAVSLADEAIGRRGNAVLSPLSIAGALHMTMAGAPEGSITFGSIARVVHLGGDLEAFLQESGDLQRAVRNASGVEVNIANRLWLDTLWTDALNPDYAATMERHFDAAPQTVAFSTTPDDARGTINEWVASQTADQIDELLPEGSVNDRTRLVLTNAVHFRGDWEVAFDAALTEQGTFHLASDEVEVPFMRRTGDIQYSDTPHFQTVALPYAGGELEMLIVMPKTEQSDRISFVNALTAETPAESTRVNLYLPKFSFRWGRSLKAPLEDLGMDDPFSRDADFSLIAAPAAEQELRITNVFHEAYVQVDEAGTEAGAATGVVMGVRSGRPQPAVDVRFDRRFYFAIRHVESGASLFLGRVDDPTAEDAIGQP